MAHHGELSLSLPLFEGYFNIDSTFTFVVIFFQVFVFQQLGVQPAEGLAGRRPLEEDPRWCGHFDDSWPTLGEGRPLDRRLQDRLP